MLIRIRPRDAKLGMFVHSFEGNWADRPFWQSHFVLTKPEDVTRLQQSAVEAVIIDTEKAQVISAPARPSPAPRPAGAAVPSGEAPRAPSPPRKPIDPNLRGLLQTVSRSKREVMKLADDVRLGRPVQVARLLPVVADLMEEVERNAIALIGILRLKARDEYTYLHSVAVSVLMMNFGRTLGIPKRTLPELGMAGLLHDIGKIQMPADILAKPGPLTADEYAVMKRHPQAGTLILRRGGEIPAVAFDVCLHHHERMDGRGYPFGLRGDTLSKAARMGAICDVYDALTSHRPYADAWPPQRALREMLEWEGQFDPALMTSFINSLGIFPAGTLVRLRESSLAIVMADNHEEPTRPTVRTFYSIAARHRVHCEDVKIAMPHILTLEQPGNWGFHDWPALSRELLAETAMAH